MCCASLGCGRFGFDPSAVSGVDGGSDDARSSDAGGDGSTVRANLAFLTSGVYDGALGGVTGADATCNAEAVAAGRPGDFVALLWASDRPDPGALLAGSSGWVRADGAWLADTAADVVIGDLTNPLAQTATGADVLGVDSGGPANRYWNGQVEGTCNDWSSTTGLGDQTWFPQWRRISDGMFDCAQPLRVACFERGHTATRPSFPITTKRVFVTSGIFAGGGVAAADALCTAEASANGLGLSAALLGTSTTAAIDRLPGGRTMRYQRPDGIELGLLASMQTWINIDASGASQTANVWTGGAAVDAVGAATCGDWNSTAGSTVVGLSWDYAGTYDSGLVQACSMPAHLYCAER